MATISTDTIITEVGNRLRDPNNFAHPRANVLDILSRVQRCLSIGLRLKVAAVAFQPTAQRCLYQTTEIAADVGRVIAVRDSGRDLFEIQHTALAENNDEWLRLEGPQPEVFSSIGRDLLVIAPFQRISPPELSVVYTTQTAALVDDAANFPVIPDDAIPLLMDVTEAIFLLRGRIFTPESALPELLSRIEQGLTASIIEQDVRHGKS